MKRVFLASFLAISSAITPMAAFAVEDVSADDTRYFLKSTKGFWKNALGARHEFADGFTADLSFVQLRLAKFAGLDPVAVKKYSILPADEASDEAVEASARRGGPAKPRLTPTAQVPWGIALMTGSDAVPAGGASISIAVVDTGISDHPDLRRRITDCKDFTTARTPIVNGKCDDQNGHGTHVSGIIAADGGEDGKGVYGIVPHASLRAYKVCGSNGSCWSDDIAVAIRTAADAGTQVINLSLGSDAASSLISDAVTYAISKGTLVVAAAGNDGPYEASIDYPGALASVVAVAALDATLAIPDWSSRGINSTTEPYSVQEGDIELTAPGVNIESTFKDGGYGILSGTSMASPHVAGLAALVWQGTADATRTMLQDLALPNDIGEPGDDDASGWGLPKIQ